jgi:RNA 3'-terminal phosphate cyclase-like protein
VSPNKPPLRHLPTLRFTHPKRITSIRGITTSTKLPAQITSRLATAAKNVLVSLLPPSRIQIYSDPAKGNVGSPGYGICLVAETSNGALYTAERTSSKTVSEDSTPEDIGEQCARALMMEISHGGCFDSLAAPTVTICSAALNGNKGDVGVIALGSNCTETWITLVRDLEQIFGVRGHFEPQDGAALICKWVGTGWVNSARGTK